MERGETITQVITERMKNEEVIAVCCKLCKYFMEGNFIMDDYCNKKSKLYTAYLVGPNTKACSSFKEDKQ
jgi:hypothetical protein